MKKQKISIAHRGFRKSSLISSLLINLSFNWKRQLTWALYFICSSPTLESQLLNSYKSLRKGFVLIKVVVSAVWVRSVWKHIYTGGWRRAAHSYLRITECIYVLSHLWKSSRPAPAYSRANFQFRGGSKFLSIWVGKSPTMILQVLQVFWGFFSFISSPFSLKHAAHDLRRVWRHPTFSVSCPLPSIF